MITHAERIAREIATYAETINIHDLPDIFHYWSHNYLRPDVEAVFGRADLTGVFASEFVRSMAQSAVRRIVSIGAGDGSVEIDIAERMLADGQRSFRIDCIELSPHLIGRGQANANAKGLDEIVRFVQSDLTTWKPCDSYGGAFAHHSLHHIQALEHVFDGLMRTLHEEASFVISDMIGRNGHMRWPEVEAILSRIWQTMPDRYKYNHQLSRHDAQFVNFDCAADGSFEGVRAQDIMPELLKRFHFEKYVAWGGLTDVFVDRSFGHNFSQGNPEDCAFIDHLARADRALLRLGAHTPTALIAVIRKLPCQLVSNGLVPEQAVRV